MEAQQKGSANRTSSTSRHSLSTAGKDTVLAANAVERTRQRQGLTREGAGVDQPKGPDFCEQTRHCRAPWPSLGRQSPIVVTGAAVASLQLQQGVASSAAVGHVRACKGGASGGASTAPEP